MPELPEVETIARGLRESILNKKIRSVQINYPGIIIMPKGHPALAKMLSGDSITRVERHGKYLKLTTKKKHRLVVHLRMTGQLFTANKSYVPNKHVHLIVTFQNGLRLIYRDIRKFGRWTVVDPKKEFQAYINAGTDALVLTLKELKELMNKRPNVKLKAFLLKQELIAGIGNIYADEICFEIRKDPETPLRKVNPAILLKAILKILKLAIKHKGTSVSDYLTSLGAKGNFQNKLRIYKQKKCTICGENVQRKKVAGRTSHFCNICQKKG